LTLALLAAALVAGALLVGMFAFGALAAGALAAGAVVVVLVVVVLVVVVVFVVAVLAGLLAALLAGASPQAMPRALRPNAIESTITFFILFNDSYLSQRIISCRQELRLIEHSRFALNSFFFRANDKIGRAKGFVNLFEQKNGFFKIFFQARVSTGTSSARLPVCIGQN
jgi:hypothetical protein